MKEKIKKINWLYKLMLPVVQAGRYLTKYYMPTCAFRIAMMLRKINILPKDKNLVSLKDKYKGKRIFVVAPGPSARVEDLERMWENREITIGVNSICYFYEQTDWRPNCFIMTDYMRVDGLRERYHYQSFDGFAKDAVVLAEQCKKYMTDQEKASDVVYLPFCYQDHWLNHFSKHRSYNRDMSIGAFDLFTVSCSAINLADYMGAKEIYLYGFDGFNIGKSNYAGGGMDDGGAGRNNVKADIHSNTKMQRGYEYLRDVALKNRITVYNATRGGYLEVFPRVDIDEIVRVREDG